MTQNPLQLNASLRNVSLDYGAIVSGVRSAEEEKLTDIGESLMDEAQSLIKPRSRSSRPGESPTQWSGGRRSLKNMALDYSASSNDIAMGPVKIDGDDGVEGMTLPELMESGGLVNRRIYRRDGSIRVIRGVRYEARSTTGKVLERAAKKNRLRDVFFDSVGA